MRNYALRRAEIRDFDAVAAIRMATIPGEYFETTFHDERVNSNYYFAVLEIDHALVGYAIIEFASPDAALVEIAVMPEKQRKGHATSLWKHVVQQVQWRKGKQVFLELREGNLAALAWYKKLGFELIRKREQYYSNPDEDALIMRCSVASPSA